MPSKKKPPNSEPTYGVGDRVKVNMHRGRIVDATIKAIIDRTDGKRLQVDFGKDETALIHLWQVVEKVLCLAKTSYTRKMNDLEQS